MLAQQQFVQSTQQQQPQMRQMLLQSEPNNGTQFRQNVLIQREQQQKSLNHFTVRTQIPVSTATDRLTPQQELRLSFFKIILANLFLIKNNKKKSANC